jgi:endonuclease YncB( thermonuclease family)
MTRGNATRGIGLHRTLASRAVILALVLLALPLVTAAATYTGRVVKVVDGETIHVLYQGGTLKVRLSEIDTPQRTQPWYK